MLTGSSLRWIRPHRWRLLGGLVCLTLLAAANSAYAYLAGPLVQLVLTGGERGLSYFQLPWLQGAVRAAGGQSLTLVAATLLGLALIKGLGHLGQALLLAGTAERVGHDLRVSFHRQLMYLPLAQHRRLSRGDLLARLLEDVRRVQEATVGVSVALVREGLGAASLLAVAVWMSPGLALLSLLVLPVVGAVTALLSRAVKRAAGRGQQDLGRAAALAAEGLEAIREIKSFGAEGRQVQALSRQSGRALGWAIRRIGVRALSPLVNEVMAGVALGATLLYGGGRIAGGELPPERFISFFVAAVLMYKPIKELGNAWQARAAGRASLDRVGALMALPAEAAADLPPLPGLRRALRLEQVDFRYAAQGEGAQGRDRPALRGASLTLRPGQVVALCGPSGAGKSTLANLVCGLEYPCAGRVRWDGEELAGPGLGRLRSQVALVPQQPLLLEGSLAENLRFGAPGADDAELVEALGAAGLGPLLADLPRGLDTHLGAAGTRLSVGEVQRVAVARALLRRVSVLVLDEPTSALDRANQEQLVDTLGRVKRDRAVLLIAHRQALLEAADRRVTLSEGRVGAPVQPSS